MFTETATDKATERSLRRARRYARKAGRFGIGGGFASSHRGSTAQPVMFTATPWQIA